MAQFTIFLWFKPDIAYPILKEIETEGGAQGEDSNTKIGA
jgi:hypothetical protein